MHLHFIIQKQYSVENCIILSAKTYYVPAPSTTAKTTISCIPYNMASEDQDHAKPMQLIEFIDGLISSLDEGQQVGVLVMDFAKVFNKVCHSLLIRKVIKMVSEERSKVGLRVC